MNNIHSQVDMRTFTEPTQFESDYADMLDNITTNGDMKENRTGIDTMSVFGGNVLYHENHKTRGNTVDRVIINKILGHVYPDEIDENLLITPCPILTLRPIKFDVAWYETIMMLRGITDTTYLEDRGISIWKANTTREFLDGRGLTETPEKSLGKGYGYQWRNWNDEKDQLVEIINQMINSPSSRRHVVSAWNPEQNKEAALDPCHILYQFNVVESPSINYVDLQFYMRSSDVVFGLPFNMLSYYLILNFVCMYLAEVTGKNWAPRNVFYVAGDSHVYSNQYEYVDEYLEREMYQPKKAGSDHMSPHLVLPRPNLDSDSLTFDEFMIWVEEHGYDLLYTPRGKMRTPRPKMAV